MAKTDERSRRPIRVGIGGWTYAPWRGSFYPPGLPAKRELEHASRHLTAIEINGTFYRSQGPKSFAKWRDETPENFVFTVKGHRAVVNAKMLGEAGEAVEWFFKSGVSELGAKARSGALAVRAVQEIRRRGSRRFSALLPREVDGVPIRHVARSAARRALSCRSSWRSRRKHNVAIVYADSDEHPAIADVTADFVYARLQRSRRRNRRAIPRPISIFGRSARRFGRPAARRTICRTSATARQRRRSATSFCSSSAAPRRRNPQRRRR